MDTSKMLSWVKTDVKRQKVVEVAHDALVAGIASLKHNIKVCEVGRIVDEYAMSQGCISVRQFCHGVGSKMHEEFQVPHYYEPSMKTKLRRGLHLQ